MKIVKAGAAAARCRGARRQAGAVLHVDNATTLHNLSVKDRLCVNS